MKRSRLIVLVILAVIILAAIAVIWLGEHYKPVLKWFKDATESKQVAKPADANEPKPAEPNKPADANEAKPAEDANKPAEPNEPNKPGDVNEPNEPNEPGEQLEALNLKDVEVKDLIAKLSEWTGKVIIPSDDAMKQKLTIYSTEKLPRDKALSHIYSALRAKGFIAEYTDDVIYLKPIAEAKLGSVPTVPPGTPLASIENRSQVVTKFFKLKSYSSVQMSNIILPLVGEYGYVTADEKTGDLMIIDTVENLIRYERIIQQFDVPEAEQTVTEVFPIKNADPREVVQLLRILLTDQVGKVKGGGGSPPKKGDSKAAVSVVIESIKTPIVLIPEPTRKWIIAKASPEDIKRIGEWIEKLDQKEVVESESETISLTFADPREVANQLNQALQRMPGAELKTSVLVQALPQARQIMVFGRPEIRKMVRKLILEIDIPPGVFETKSFQLEHADPEEIKENLEALYEDINANLRWWQRRHQRSRSTESVRVIAFPTMQQVTVIASAENMIKIKEQIEQWDIPLDVEKVKPLIIELHNSDPVKMADLLSRLFSEDTSGSNRPWWMWWGDDSEDKKKIVGALYGQLTFAAVPDTKKIIVISKIPEAYKVIEGLVKELDSMEVAELPMLVTLKYADAEDLCEQLNAILNEPGTLSPIRRSKRGLSAYSTDESGQATSQAGQDDSGTNQANMITPWWNQTQGRSRVGEEMPTSNLIGRIRFTPVYRSKVILVLSPKEYQESIREIIEQLDRPAKQVMIKAIIIEVSHESMTSLGIKLSSDPLAFGALGENSLMALTSLAYTENQGTFIIGGDTFKKGATTTVNVNTLVNLLIKEADAKILNQPTLWTKDNEEAEFFKGRSVPFVKSSQLSTEGTAQRDSVEYRNVGVTLRIRPNITPEKAVDITIHLNISEVEQALVQGNIAISELNTITHMIVEDGETIMLGGILFQTDNQIEQKVPLLGDLPLVGGLFRHYDTILSNNELIIFITPYVVDANSSPKTLKELESAENKLEDVLDQLDAALGADSNNP